MKGHTSTIRDKIFNDIHFYETSERYHHVRNSEYEKHRGSKEAKTYQKKQEGTFKDYHFTSMSNPLGGKKTRYDKPKYEMENHKKTVWGSSFRKTDPVNMYYERKPVQPRTKAPFENTKEYKVDVERKNYLPATR